MDYRKDKRFSDITEDWIPKRIPLPIPHMHGDEIRYVQEAYDTDWVTTVGPNINELERIAAEYVGLPYAVAVSSGTASLHLAIRSAAQRIYHSNSGITTPDGIGSGGSLYGRKVFCSDMTFAATVNPILYEGGEPVYIDTEYDSWNMDPAALKKAFEIYPEVRIVVLVHLYGTPAKVDEIRSICDAHGALLIEDAAESLGASRNGKQTGSYGDLSAISFNGNKIITGSTGGMLLTAEKEEADRVRKWSTQAREAAGWYQHEEVGYNYRMSNVIAGLVRGQWAHLDEHIRSKREIYEHYKKGFAGIPVRMNPYEEKSSPNFWMSCITVEPEAMCAQTRDDHRSCWQTESGKSCPEEILAVMKTFHMEGRPLWKPMHLQPIYRNHAFITKEGSGRGSSNAYNSAMGCSDAGADLFDRGLCLPSDIAMTAEEQEKVITIIRRCFQ